MNFSINTTISLVLFAIFIALFLSNWFTVVNYLINKKHSSWIPLIGGIAGSASLLVYQNPNLHIYWWIPLVIDWGCLPGLFFSLLYFIRHIFVNTRGKMVSIHLFPQQQRKK